MPELPEVETIVRTLRPLIAGKRIEGVEMLNPGTVDGPDDLAGLAGGRIVGVRRRGKLVLVDVAETVLPGFAVHLKMTGRLFVYPADTPPGLHTRLMFDLHGEAGDARLFFDDARKFGYVRGLSEASVREWAFWHKLGPEPLELTATEFAGLFCGRNAAMKALLLDQQVLAGVGNIYADESLFRAGIHPRTRAARLDVHTLQTLHGHLVDVLNESIEACGSSIRDYRTARGDAGAFQNAFRVYGRAGKPCVVCGATLASATVAGRTTVFCPDCQQE